MTRALTIVLVLGTLVTAAALYAGWSRHRSSEPPAAALTPPSAAEAASYVGSSACAGCHAGQHRSWQASQHAQAMQAATEATVLGDFGGARFDHMGTSSEFFRRDGKFMVRTDGPDGRLAEFEVRHTFGIYPLQQYLLELPGGRLQALSIAWDARSRESGGQRWFHLYPGEPIDHRDELHWTGRQQNWNFMCADCHSTEVRKNYDPATDTYATGWSEISVGCESCHGPGSAHVRLARQGRGAAGLTVALDERHDARWVIDPASGNARRHPERSSSRELDVCAQCHARRGQVSDSYRAGEPFLDHYRPASLQAGLYHADGQQHEEVYDWGSFLSSRMHAAGVTCGDCHEPHSAQLRAPGNAVCAQCHLPAKYDSASHHFHENGSTGSACAACHMPTTTYMVVDPRHDHSFRIPRPDRSVTLGVPNACNGCHEDRTPEWAAQSVRRHHPRPASGYQGFAEAFAASDRGEPGATRALLEVVADPDQSAIARAGALDRLATRPDATAVGGATAALADASPLVRGAALGVIELLPPLERRAALPLLSDPVRTVRMAAATTLAPLADDALGEYAAAFESAAAEYLAAERFNADRPEHRTNIGNFHAERGDVAQAEAAYRSAIALEPRFVPAWVNLAELQRSQGRESDADASLRAGLAESPRDADLHHALGLSLVRQQRLDEALEELGTAAKGCASQHALRICACGRAACRRPAAGRDRRARARATGGAGGSRRAGRACAVSCSSRRPGEVRPRGTEAT